MAIVPRPPPPFIRTSSSFFFYTHYSLLSYLSSVCGTSCLLSDNIHNAVLDCFFVPLESVLLPGVVQNLGVQVVAREAFLKKSNQVRVVGFLLELEAAAVLHVLLELWWVTLAELLKWSLDLLLLDVVVTLILAAAWESLPGEAAPQEVKQHVANAL